MSSPFSNSPPTIDTSLAASGGPSKGAPSPRPVIADVYRSYSIGDVAFWDFSRRQSSGGLSTPGGGFTFTSLLNRWYPTSTAASTTPTQPMMPTIPDNKPSGVVCTPDGVCTLPPRMPQSASPAFPSSTTTSGQRSWSAWIFGQK